MSAKVSIIISAFNAEKYLGQTLDSVLLQTYQDIEVIVVNDGSSDSTLQIANQYLSRGIKVFTQRNKGQDAALNFGYKQSTGDYIKFMDSDDLINPEMVEIQMKTLNGEKDYVAYGEWARFIVDNPLTAKFNSLSYWKDMSPMDFLTALPDGVMLQCGIILIPRELIDMAGLWDERLILFNDTEFFNRVFLKSKGIKFSKGARLYYRSGLPNSISVGKTRRFYESTFLATKLIADQLLRVEDSFRVRNLVSNMYLNRYREFYPQFSDLGMLHEKEIKEIGCGTAKPQGGKIFKVLCYIFGWKIPKRLQNINRKLFY